MLWHSRPIHNLTRSVGVDQNLTELVGHVSVRECFLYLQTEMNKGNWYADNQDGKWHLDKRSGFFPMRYYPNDNPGTTMTNCERLIKPRVPEQHGEPRRSDRNREKSAVEGGKTSRPSSSSRKPRDRHTIKGPGYDGGSSTQRTNTQRELDKKFKPFEQSQRASSSSQQPRDQHTMRRPGHDRGISTQRTDTYREPGKKLQPSEQGQRAHSVQSGRPSTNASSDQSKPAGKNGSSDIRISPSPAKASLARHELPALRANGGKENVPATLDSVRPKTLDTDGVLKPRSEVRAQQHRAGQPPEARHRSTVADQERQQRDRTERNPRAPVEER